MAQALFCSKCGTELVNVGGAAWACVVCDMPGEPEHSYKNWCWNCPEEINSEYCNKSLTPGMGYHCRSCGEDLTGWKIKKGIIPVIPVVGERIRVSF